MPEHDCEHICCDERRDPLHDHFLSPADCPRCAARWEPDPDLVELQEAHAALMATQCPCGHPYSVHDKQRSDGGPPFCNYTLARRCGCNGLGLEAS